MKKVFVQLWKWVLKYRKNIIYGALALFAVQICFFDIGGIGLDNEVFAAEEKQTASQNLDFNAKAEEWMSSFSFFKKVVYVALFPLLAIMGKLVDNSLVYGEAFGFDVILWNLWNVVRNLANFALGFIFVYFIFEYLITGNSKKDPQWLIKRALIAGIGIQASWFIMAALLDVSTILTYGIGGLPLSALGTSSTETDIEGGKTGQKKQEYNPYVWQTNISVDADEFDTVAMYMSNNPSDPTQKIYISECVPFDYLSGTNKEQLLLAPKYVYYKSRNNYYPTQHNVCHFDGQVYYFSSILNYDGGGEGTNITCDGTDSEKCKTAQQTYSVKIKELKDRMGKEDVKSQVEGYILNGQLLQVGNAHAGGGVYGTVFTGISYTDEQKRGLDVGNEWSGNNGAGGLIRLKDLGGDGSYVGVFSSLYSSLLNAGFNLKVSDEASSSLFVNTLNALLSLVHMLAIAIPLIAMMIVCVMRIGVLWMAIILSPAIILVKVFDWEKTFEKLKEPFVYLTVENLIRIIFSPVIICFAISISTVLVRVIEDVNWKDVEIATTDGLMGGLVQVAISNASVNLGKLIFAAVGVAITWFLVWAAIQSSKLGESGIIKGLKDYATSALGSIPIVPVPTKDGKWQMVGAGSVFGDNGVINRAIENVKTTYNSKSDDAVKAILGQEQESSPEVKQFDAYKTKLLEGPISGDWTQPIIITSEDGKSNKSLSFGDFSEDQKKDIIESINAITDEAKRKAFGDKAPTVPVGGSIYKFVEEKDSAGKPVYKYKEQGAQTS